MNNWLQDLKVGDEVFVSYGHGMFLESVEAVTKTTLTVGGDKFRRKSGTCVESPSKWLEDRTDPEARWKWARGVLREAMTGFTILTKSMTRLEDTDVMLRYAATLNAMTAAIKKYAGGG